MGMRKRRPSHKVALAAGKGILVAPPYRQGPVVQQTGISHPEPVDTAVPDLLCSCRLCSSLLVLLTTSLEVIVSSTRRP